MNKFLTSDKVLYSMPWIYAISTLTFEILHIILKSFPSVFDLGIEIINVLIVFGITTSYKAHEKNIMKTLFGALMMGGIIYFFYSVCYCFDKPEYILSTVIFSIMTLLYIVLFVNHLILGYGHKANPSRTNLNRVVGLLLILCNIIITVPYFTEPITILLSILSIISEAAIIIEILCIETKVDAYKIIRESK